MQTVKAPLRKLETIAMYGAGVGLAAMMLITVVDVLLRYALNAPLGFSQEVITHYLLPAAFFLALADTLREDGHIKITLVDRFVSTRARWLMSVVGHVLSAALFAVIAWHGIEATLDAWRAGNTYPGYILWPTWISLILVPIGVVLLEARVLQRLATLITQRKATNYGVVDSVEGSADPVEEAVKR